MGFIARAGYQAEAMDLSVQNFDEDKARRARFVGISVPMHTALRLGIRVAQSVRKVNPDCHICFYGLYASLNADYLLGSIADSVVGGEYEQALVELIKTVLPEPEPPIDITGVPTRPRVLERLSFPLPDRSALPPLETYARLEIRGDQLPVGYVEASRGCLHHCTHCPIPPVYEGRFFIVPREVVLEDIRRLVASGARHITFGDPDFLNGPTHSLRVVRAMHREFPDLTFDFTAKVEHILKYRELFPELGRLGCAFMVSAVESLSDTVLMHLEKGHTPADVYQALRIARESGIALRPSLVAFTPWTTLGDYLELLDFVDSEGLIDHVDPVQYAIRLLVPPGSVLITRIESKGWLGPLVQESFSYTWSHPDPRMDALQSEVAALVEREALAKEDAASTFWKVCDLASGSAGEPRLSRRAALVDALRLRPPRLTEAWFC
jgi:radical SAM superfamily enzyme YgiQ (UPF0313 family)